MKSYRNINRMYSVNNYTQQEINVMLIQKINEVIEKCNKTFEIVEQAEENVQSNWDETDISSDSYILNKPSLSSVAISGSYNDLTDKPSLSSVSISGSYNDLTDKPSAISISANGNTYIPNSNGLITLPDYPSSSGGSGTINTSNLITFDDHYVGDCNTHLVNGYIKTNTLTTNLPTGCINNLSSWGILFCIMENSDHGTGTQMFFPVSGDYVGRIFTRSIEKLKIPEKAKTSKWVLLAIDSNYDSATAVSQSDLDEMS